MKRLAFLFLIAICAIPAFAQESNDAKNIVTLVAARDFDEVLVNGDVTVECVFNADYHRYVAYSTADEDAKRIVCRNDSNRLIIDGNTELNEINSRIVVFCTDSLKAVILNGSGNLVVKETPRLERLHVIQNANGSIKIGDLKAHFLSIVNNGPGSVFAEDVKARRLSVVNNGSGEMNFNTIKAFEGSFVSNGNTDITLSDILVRQATFVSNSSGNLTLSGKTRELTLVKNGTGVIDISNLSYKTISDNCAE